MRAPAARRGPSRVGVRALAPRAKCRVWAIGPFTERRAPMLATLAMLSRDRAVRMEEVLMLKSIVLYAMSFALVGIGYGLAKTALNGDPLAADMGLVITVGLTGAIGGYIAWRSGRGPSGD